MFTTLDNADVHPNTYQGFSEWFVMDARANLRLTDHWSGGLGVDNLLNRKYFLFHPFPQRTLVANLKFGF
jgi:iron complex outermembrane receptor protein